MSKQQRDATNALILIIYAVVVVFITLLALYYFRGLEDPRNREVFYSYMGLLAFFIFTVVLDKLSFRTADFTYFHEPEKGVFSNIKFVQDKLSLLFGSLIIFAPLTIFAAYNTVQGSFVGFTQYQIAEAGQLLLAMEPAVLTETLILSIMAGIGWYGAYSLSSDGKKKEILVFGVLVAAIVTVLFAYALHGFRYGNSERDLVMVLLFFGLSVLTIVVSGSIIPALVFHYLNNGAGSAYVVLGFDFTIVLLTIIFVVSIAGFFYRVRALRGVKFA